VYLSLSVILHVNLIKVKNHNNKRSHASGGPQKHLRPHTRQIPSNNFINTCAQKKNKNNDNFNFNFNFSAF